MSLILKNSIEKKNSSSNPASNHNPHGLYGSCIHYVLSDLFPFSAFMGIIEVEEDTLSAEVPVSFF